MRKSAALFPLFFLLFCLPATASPFAGYKGLGASGMACQAGQEFAAPYDGEFYKSLAGLERVTIGDMPLADGQTVALELEVYYPFSPGCKITEMSPSGPIEHRLPQGRYFYRGKVSGVAGSRAFFIFGAGIFSGFVEVGGQLYVYGLMGGESGGKTEAACTLFNPSQEPPVEPYCRNEALGNPRPLGDLTDGQVFLEAVPPPEGDRQAGIAIEMDYEAFSHFGSVQAATDYATALVGAVSTIYDADVLTTLAISNMRVWSSSSDPYADGNDASALLDNLLAEYNANMTSVNRAAAHLFSVRPQMGGVAYMGVLCQKSWAYGVDGIKGTYTYPTSAYTWDANCFAHELGHTFGSDHTHCYGTAQGLSDWIDKCYSGESGRGCFGETAEAPASMTDRTIMSYCHLLSPWTLTMNFDDPAQPTRGYTKNKIRQGALAAACLSSPTCSLSCTATVPTSTTAGQSVSFSSSATPSGCSGSVGYSWTFGDGQSSTSQNSSHTYTTAGTYIWSMTATVQSVTCTKNGSITVNPAPACSLTCTASAPASGTVGSPIQFSSTASPSNCTGQVSHSWDFGDGSTSAQQNLQHAYAAPGNYGWSYTATIQGVQCTKGGSIAIAAPCSVTCTASAPASVTAGALASFTATAQLSNCSGQATYSWNFGDGGTSQLQNPTHSYSASGNYSWGMTARADGVNCTKTGTIAVVDACSVSCTASAPQSALAGAQVQFDSTAQASNCSGAVTIAWNFGDGATSQQQNATHTYASAGTYSWSMVASAGTESCTRNGTITISDPCSIACTASAPPAGTAGEAVAFSSSAQASNCTAPPSYSWDFGDGTASQQQSPAHTYASAGTYIWSFSATADGSACTRGGEIAIAPPCTIECSAGAVPSAGVAPLAVSFTCDAVATACQGPVVFAWSFGDGTTSALEDPSHTYQQPGKYVWTLTVTAGGESCARGGEITVEPPCALTCNATAFPVSGTAPLEVAFHAEAEAANCTTQPAYSWNFGDGQTSSLRDPVHTYAAAGSYAWTLSVTAGDKSCGKEGSVTVSPGVPGDCDGNGTVSIGEVQRAINMFLGLAAAGCGADCNNDGQVSIGEVQKVINAFLGLPSRC